MITKEEVLEKLKEVIDPELNINIVDLGLIYDVKIYSSSSLRRHPRENGDPRSLDSRLRGNDTGFNVDIKMTLTSPGCPLSAIFEEWVQDSVKKIKGVKNVTIDLVWEPAWSPERMTEETRETLGIIE